MAEPEDGFLSRWSRRKRRADRPSAPEAQRREGASAEAAGTRPPPGARAEPPGEPAAEAAGDPQVIARLPDIDSLDETSDFSAFLQEGVPDALRRKALRKLWRLNPVLANLDGINDYDEDFTDAARVVEGIKTLYKVARGYVDEGAGPAREGEPAQAREDAGSAPVARPKGEPGQHGSEAAPHGEPEPPEPQATAAPEPGAAHRKPEVSRSARRSARDRRWGRSSL